MFAGPQIHIGEGMHGEFLGLGTLEVNKAPPFEYSEGSVQVNGRQELSFPTILRVEHGQGAG